jgi:predicted NBD/HSP70 family sugar kinase
MEHLRIRSAVNANLQNSINTSLILHYVRKLGTTYRSEISKALHLSLPAVSRAVDHLIQKGYLIEHKIITASGKQAHQVEINASLGMSVGISIELPFMKIARMDMAGKLVNVQEISLDTTQSNLEQIIIDQMAQFLHQKQFIDDIEIPTVALTLTVPAAIDKKQELVHAVLYGNMKELNLKRIFEQTFTIPVFLENNENMAALAEKHYLDGIEENDFAYITIHHGIGAGLMLNGQLHRGVNGAAGEIGYQHLINNPFTGTETFESMASIHQIQQIAMNHIHKGKGEDIFKAANYSYNNITHQLVGDLAANGSEDAKSILALYAKTLAIGIGNLLVALNPETIIFGGQLVDIKQVENHVIGPLREYLDELIPFPLPEMRMTRLGKEASVIGACQMGLEHTILRHYPYSITG